MVGLPEGYCIDSTEVTRAQYAAWLATVTPERIARRPSTWCAWNTTFTPDAPGMAGTHVCQTNCDNHPQVRVDWCDAHAYCMDVGKSLCGKIGREALAYADYADVTKSEWYSACTSGGQNTYTYGTNYSSGTCNTSDRWTSDTATTVAVASSPQCQGTGQYAGVYDLSGNVQEWEDSCAPIDYNYPERDKCRVRGGAYHLFKQSETACNYDASWDRFLHDDSIGFRCCSGWRAPNPVP